MKVSLESFHDLMMVLLASADLFVSVLIASVTFVAPLPVLAATNATTHQSAATNPQCMRRVTVTSKPCGAMIYIDGIQVGRTPMSFPMPTGRYTLVLLAPGHQPYGQRILVPDAPLDSSRQNLRIDPSESIRSTSATRWAGCQLPAFSGQL
jgi:hypothetical protein